MKVPKLSIPRNMIQKSGSILNVNNKNDDLVITEPNTAGISPKVNKLSPSSSLDRLNDDGRDNARVNSELR